MQDHWDRSQVVRYNTNPIFFQEEELLRIPFYDAEWSLQKIKKHSVFISSGAIPIKGFHVLLEAAAILKQKYPDFMIRVPLDGKRVERLSKLTSNDYELYLDSLITKLNLRGHIQFLGKLDEHQMAKTLASSQRFCIAFF